MESQNFISSQRFILTRYTPDIGIFQYTSWILPSTFYNITILVYVSLVVFNNKCSHSVHVETTFLAEYHIRNQRTRLPQEIR